MAWAGVSEGRRAMAVRQQQVDQVAAGGAGLAGGRHAELVRQREVAAVGVALV